MAFNEKLANNTREILSGSIEAWEEKRMFGGLCFMVNEKMCVGVEKDRLMIRLNPEAMDEALEKDGCTAMDFNGRVMKGFVFVDAGVLAEKRALEYWIKKALEYNIIAKPSKKKKG